MPHRLIHRRNSLWWYMVYENRDVDDDNIENLSVNNLMIKLI
jgi:hypothetical protein